MFFDTHVHFAPDADEAVIDAVVSQAGSAGVDRMIAVGGSPGLNRAACLGGGHFPATVGVALGFDRDQVDLLDGAEPVEAMLKALVVAARGAHAAVMAVGEIGLDFHYSPASADAQLELFERQLVLAAQLELPVIVHSRDAEAATLDILRRHARRWGQSARPPGVLHCFTGSASFADALVECGYMISFSGIVTFKNASPLRAVAAQVPAESLLIETDSPFLAPVPMRGKTNQPAYLPHVAEALAACRGQSREAVAEITWHNALRLFGSPGQADIQVANIL